MPRQVRQVCRHCGQRHITRPRGLCWLCYRDPAIAGMYPAKHRGGRPKYVTNDHEPTWED